MEITLADSDATRAFARLLAPLLAGGARLLPVFFYGGLGAGKTTFISALVKALPGGEEAETSSPSFTVCNLYATTPPVAHYDMYRNENNAADESLLDFLDGERHLVLVEWAQRLPEYALPPDRLACEMTAVADARIVRFTAFGRDAENFLRTLRSRAEPFSRANP